MEIMLRIQKFDPDTSWELWSFDREMSKIVFLILTFIGLLIAVLVPILLRYFRVVSKNDANEYANTKRYMFVPDLNDIDISYEENFGAEISKTTVIPSQNDEAVKYPGLEAEALSSLHAALEMKQIGKHDKALKLFQHASMLAPKHSDILNHYGEFLEETKKDIVLADQLYFKALTYSPDHSGALANRLRTAQVVDEMDMNVLRRIDSKRDTLSRIPDSNAAFRRAKKEAYFQHIHHTVAIEGNTMTLSQARAIVETRMAVAGKSVMEHNEILGLDAAMKYINTTIINRLGTISVKEILEIHKRVLGYVDPISCGLFRRTQVYVGGHIPPGPSDLAVLMADFAQWLNSEEALRLHPVRYAALAHYKLVHIHPFSDGNGRTARLLMNAILMQAGFPPVIILKQDRHRYYENLELANQGDVRPFVRFIAECTERTLDLYLWATSEFATNMRALDQGKTIILSDLNIGNEEN